MPQLLVVGLDLRSGQEVPCHPERLDQLRAKSYKGDQTLVCALCYAGDGAEPGTQIPLVVRGREGGSRRPHFAHPPHQAPQDTHSPESLWHLEAKHVIARWAEQLPNVGKVVVEGWTTGRKRRADIHIELDDGTVLAIEVQATPLADSTWKARHRDYRANGITDVWLWHPDTQVHWIASRHHQPLWQFDPIEQRLTLLAGAAHRRDVGWWHETDLAKFAIHTPPCTGDRIQPFDLSLTQARLDSSGIVLPAALHTTIPADLEQIAQEATKHQNREQESTTRPTTRDHTLNTQDDATAVVHDATDPSVPTTRPASATLKTKTATSSEESVEIEAPAPHATPHPSKRSPLGCSAEEFHCAQCYLRVIIRWRRRADDTGEARGTEPDPLPTLNTIGPDGRAAGSIGAVSP